MQRLTAAPTRWAVGMSAGMAWRAVFPVMGGASASAVAVATRPTAMEVGQRSPVDKASMEEGGAKTECND